MTISVSQPKEVPEALGVGAHFCRFETPSVKNGWLVWKDQFSGKQNGLFLDHPLRK